MALSKNRIKYFHSLEQKKNRKADKVFLAEGPKLVGDLLGHFPCQFLLATSEWLSRNRPLSTVADATEVSEEELSRASLLKTPQQVLAVFRQPDEETDISVISHSLCLALDDVQDPGNLGTIVRLADWFGIEHIFCSPNTVDIYNPKTVQATMGGIARVRLHYTPLPEFIRSLKDIPVYGTFLDGENMYGQPLSKNGLTKEMAHAMSMNYGINYGVAPNAGEGGVGRMLADDKEVYDYFNEVKGMPFLCGVQGEGRKWTATFSQEALGIFDYLFTDAMTIIDHKGRNSRIYRAEEALFDDITLEQYMDHLVDQTVLILTNEPADIYANPTFLPDTMAHDYDKYWTDGRIERVLDVLQQHGIALEINARYRIPSFEIIRRAKARGIKFTFGTNNVDADFGRLEYCAEAIKQCGLTADDIWFPPMSTRRSRPIVIYNRFE